MELTWALVDQLVQVPDVLVWTILWTGKGGWLSGGADHQRVLFEIRPIDPFQVSNQAAPNGCASSPGRQLALDPTVELDTDGKPKCFDDQTVFLLGQAHTAKVQKAFGEAMVTMKDLYIIHEETSVAERHERLRGGGVLSQTEQLLLISSLGD